MIKIINRQICIDETLEMAGADDRIRILDKLTSMKVATAVNE